MDATKSNIADFGGIATVTVEGFDVVAVAATAGTGGFATALVGGLGVAAEAGALANGRPRG